MDRFDNVKELAGFMGIEYSQQVKWINDEISNWLACGNSSIVDDIYKEPACTFQVNFECRSFYIGVTEICVDEEYGAYKVFYWIEEV